MTKLRSEAGFLLLEVLLAMSLLAVGLFVLIDSVSKCVAAARSVQNYSIAATLLANKSYEFRVERPLDDLEQEGTFEDYPQYAWSRTFEPYESVEELQGLWIQTITVTWLERGQPVSDSIVEYRYLPQKQR